MQWAAGEQQLQLQQPQQEQQGEDGGGDGGVKDGGVAPKLAEAGSTHMRQSERLARWASAECYNDSEHSISPPWVCHVTSLLLSHILFHFMRKGRSRHHGCGTFRAGFSSLRTAESLKLIVHLSHLRRSDLTNPRKRKCKSDLPREASAHSDFIKCMPLLLLSQDTAQTKFALCL